MPTIREISEFLASNGLAVRLPPGVDDTRVTAPSALEGAVAGALSWLSAKRLAQDHSQVSDFAGAFLVAPSEAPAVRLVHGVCVPCFSPKLAFSKVVSAFFPELSAWPWPTAPSFVSAQSRLATSARLAPGVVVGAGCVIEDGVEIGPGTVLAHTRVGPGTRIGANCSLGLAGFGFDRTETGEWFRFPHVGGVDIGRDVEIGSNTCIDRGSLGNTCIGDGAKIDNLVHIAHNVRVGANALVIANAMLGGSAQIGEGTWVAPSASVMNQVTIGAGATVGMGAVVTKNVRDGVTVAGVPAKELQPKG